MFGCVKKGEYSLKLTSLLLLLLLIITTNVAIFDVGVGATYWVYLGVFGLYLILPKKSALIGKYTFCY